MDIQDFIKKGCQANVQDRLESVDAFQKGIKKLIEVYGEQPLELTLWSQHSEVDRHHLIQLWSEYTPDSSEKEEIHSNETLIWEEESSHLIQSSDTSKGPKSKIQEAKNVNDLASMSEVPIESEPNGNVWSYIIKAIVNSIRWVVASFGVYVLVSVGLVIFFTLQNKGQQSVLTLSENGLNIAVDKPVQVHTSRMEPIVLPPSEIEYFSLDGHLIAAVLETDESGNGKRRLFWGPSFSNDVVLEWGQKSFNNNNDLDWNQGHHLFELQRQGTSSNGEKWDFFYYDSRFDTPAQRGLERKESGLLTLQCDQTQYTFTSVEAPSKVHWYESSLARKVKLLAKDLRFNCFYIDQLRYNEENPKYRFFKGTKNNMQLMDVIDSSIQYDEIHILTTKGVLEMKGNDGTWTPNPIGKSSSVSIEKMNSNQNGQFIYNDLGVYPTNLLGTPSDILWLNSK